MGLHELWQLWHQGRFAPEDILAELALESQDLLRVAKAEKERCETFRMRESKAYSQGR